MIKKAKGRNIGANYDRACVDCWVWSKEEKMFEIESNVPLPEGDFGKTKRKYPFNEMEAGDSFFTPADGITRTRIMNSLHNSLKARRFTKEGLEGCFVCRKVAGGVRCWRKE